MAVLFGPEYAWQNSPGVLSLLLKGLSVPGCNYVNFRAIIV